MTALPASAGDTEAPEPLEPERYKVQFTATEEYVRLVEEAKALLSHAVPHVTLEEIQLRAMRTFVCVATAHPPEPNVVHPRQRGRQIPAAVRRAVYERDSKRCTYVDSTGTHCGETHRLEFHHLKPFATGGEHSASNLTLRCRAHNELAAEEDFGREVIEERRESSVHDSFGRSGAASGCATGACC
jgi:hypothetical protein